MPGIKQVATTSPKSAKTSAGKGVAAKRPGKGTGVVVTAKSARKSADVVLAATKRISNAASATVATKRTSKAPEVVLAAKRASKGASAVAATKRTSKSSSGRLLIAQYSGKNATPLVEITFGLVSASVERPTDAHVKRAVTASKKVAKGLGKRLVTPGVSLRHRPGVPVFTADPTDPQRVVRRLHGKSERGHFVKGQFKPEESAA